MFINYKREIYALAHLNLSTTSFKCGHLRMAVVHLPIKFGVDICIQSRVIDIFPKFKMAAATILDFQFM